jgi:TP901 family phage tail tape measure protein
MRNATKRGYQFGTVVKGILAANIIRSGIGQIAGGLTKVGTDYLEFGDVMTGAVARFDEVNTKSAAFGQAITTQSKGVRTAILGTRSSAVDGAMSLNELAKAGYNSAAAMKILPNLTAFATAAQEKLADATKMSSDILGGFGLKNDNVAIQYKNHMKLNDQLTKSALLATGDMKDLFETLQVVAPISGEIKASQEEVLALTIALSNAGIKGTEAATAIKRGWLNLFMSTGQMQKELNANGIFPYDPKTGAPQKYTAVLKQFTKVVDKLQPQRRNLILRNIFGVYGMAGQIKMMRELKAIGEYEDKIRSADGLTQRMADAANTSWKASFQKLGNAALEAGFKILDAFAVKGKSGVDTLTASIQNFNVDPIISGLKSTVWLVEKLGAVIQPLMFWIPYLAAGALMWKGAMRVLGFAFKTATALIGLAEAGFAVFMDGILGGTAIISATVLPVIATLAAAFSTISAGYSLITGRDNAISMLAQWAGIVPKLRTDENGQVLGRASDSQQYPWWREEAPNATEAQARANGTWQGQLNILGAPAGSTVSGGSSSGAPSISMHLLGVNP